MFTPATASALSSSTIVVGVDLSVAADDAAELAARLARRNGDRVLLVHVSPVPLHEDSTMGDTLREALADARAGLVRHGVDVDVAVEAGGVVDVLSSMARGARMLIVAGTGVPNQEQHAGRTARALARHASVPVLVIEDGARLDAWLRGDTTLKLLIAAAFDDALPSLHAAAQWWRSLGPVDITVAHTSYPPEESRRLGMRPRSLVENEPAVDALVQSELASLFATVDGTGRLVIKVHSALGRTDAHIAHAAAEVDADVVVIGSHQRTGLELLFRGSVDDGVLRLRQGNVMVVPCPHEW